MSDPDHGHDTNPQESLEDRHRRENKELRAQVQALKKSATKGDKKRKKEVQAEIAQLELDLETRHQKERLAAVAEVEKEPEDASVETITQQMDKLPSLEDTPTTSTTRKPNRQQLRKQRKQAEMERMRQEAELESKTAVNWKQVEDDGIRELLHASQLEVHEIAPDGHCLYAAVAHQLSLVGNVRDVPLSYKDVRRMAAEYLREHQQDFLPFISMDGDSVEDVLDDEGYQQYCDKVESSAEWGGEIELRALSHRLQRPIQVFQMGMPVLKIGEDLFGDTRQPLLVSYHRHSYGLGEHYNSVVPTRQSS